MLHKNLIKNSGFRALQREEVSAVTGGLNINVDGTQPGNGLPGIGDGLQGNGNETGNSPDPTLGGGL